MRKMMTFGLVAAIAIAAPLAAKDDCRHAEPRSASFEAAGVKRVLIDAESGSLRVSGTRGAGTVSVEALACASTESALRQIVFKAERKGDTVRIEAETPDQWGVFSWNNYARLDLVVELPQDVAVSIDDGSGSIEVSGVGDLKIEDGSGSIKVSDSGRVSIRDGSGSISVRGARSVEVRDGSGSIDLEDISGDVRIEEDGSGQIDVARVGGNVWIGRDGSGSIDVQDVRGDFIVERDGSGSIRNRGVLGRVSIPRD